MEEFDRNWKRFSERSTCWFLLIQWCESSFERKQTWLKRQWHFWERRIRRMQFLLDIGFWHSVEEAWTRLFPTQSRFICIPEKDRKNHTFWRKKFGPLFLFQYVWFWPPFYFSLFLLHYFWSGQVEVQIKAHARVAPFLSFQGHLFKRYL